MNRNLIAIGLSLGLVLFWHGLTTESSTVSIQPVVAVSQVAPELGRAVDVQTLNASTSDRQAPQFSLEGMNGNTLSLQNFQGNPVLLNVWASYCPYCIHEMSMLEDISQAHQHLTVVGINAGEHQETVRSYMQRTNVTYPIVIDQSGEVVLNYQVKRLPATFLLNESGQIMWTNYGAIQREELETQLNHLNTTKTLTQGESL